MKKVIILLIVFLIMLFGCDREQNTENDLDIEKYIGKIWVVKDWDVQEESSYISFIISQLDTEQIEGYFDIDETIMPDIRIYTKEENESQTDEYYGKFKGTIDQNIATCTIEWEKTGVMGKMEIEFMDNDLKVRLTSEKNTESNETRIDGEFVFKTFNIKDEEEKDFIFKDEIYPVDINKWGTIDFVSRFREGSKHSVLFVYLTDKSGNIIYDFGYPNYFPSASYVHDFKFTDLNSDGLEDLILILSCGGDTRQARVYFQNSKKGFEENEVLFDKLNSEKDSYNKDVECVINFIETENF